jgi:hypothetical protein
VTRDWPISDLVNWLALQRGYRSCLASCSVSTRLRYGDIDRAQLAICHRLIYRCPPEYSDGWPIDFRSIGLDISACLGSIRERGDRYDIVLVDPWHEYGASMRDLTEALSLLTDHGTIVVNNCLFRTPAECPVSHFIAGGWCGPTSRAYLDFVFARPNLEFRTVDIENGCGVIREHSGLARLLRWWPASRHRRTLIALWRGLGNDFTKSVGVLQHNKTLLSNLRSLDDFIAEEQRASGLRTSHLS